ncbi:efflux RND transporter periplasmic adaptor subunit [Pseudomarimonas arenosa]|uniref:HlyD family efflux transporter periplasmic adaptor subunit n=1 Tax=Pseudomarimonas arenosa TaxID=2774145 RepID=A0AAW3ZKM5_9GAMM|nr:HlyD family efflux transporter periplasmic adaptor subunit [Pseudomarimonas arenosa]MBD8525744.1 HlyD family efflux transporter periplasmic adaptor subunit [Pseudomarimonas arenosa]
MSDSPSALRPGLRLSLAVALALMATACAAPEGSSEALEQVVVAPLKLEIEARGELRSVKSTPLTVPGENWARRQYAWLVTDGEWVEQGDLVAQFSADEIELALSKAELDLRRNALARAAKQDELQVSDGRVQVDIAEVDTQLDIARRYAGADLDMLARNEVLDAIQDQAFLSTKRDVLDWKSDQSSARGAAELGVLDSQKSSLELTADIKRKDLGALEVRAPNAGVVVLTADWGGDKPKLGAATWAGQEFASLPDPSTLEVQLKLPQLEAQALKVGQKVELFPLGRPEQRIESELSWVASAPQQSGRRNPIKTISVKAPVDAESARRWQWVPGQAFVGRIVLAEHAEAISVPNLSVISAGEKRYVEVVTGDVVERREVELGVRGPGRSHVLSGLKAGEQIRVLPQLEDSQA